MQKVFYELKFSGKLPSPAGVGMRILQLTQDPTTGIDEITAVVRTDPALTGRILKVANCGMRAGGPVNAPLDEAVMRLGFQCLRDLVLGFSLVSSNSKSSCPSFDYNAFWHGSLGRAVSAQHLTELVGRGSGAESYICGLLCNIGSLGLAVAHPQRYSQLLESKDAANVESLAALESHTFGINHRELTQAMLCDWGFPEPMAAMGSSYRAAIDPQQKQPEHLRVLRQILQLSDHIVSAIYAKVKATEGLAPEVVEAFAKLDVEASLILPTLGAIRRVWAEWSALLEVPGPKPKDRRTSAPGSTATPGTEGGNGTATAPATPTEGGSAGAAADAVDAAATVVTGTLVNACNIDPSLKGNDQGPGVVLVMSRDPRATDGFKAWIEAAGYREIQTANVTEALSLAVLHNPPIVIGHDPNRDTESMLLCKALRRFEAGRNVYFILATRDQSSSHLLSAFEAGADDHLPLPCTKGEGVLRLRAARRVLQLNTRVAEQEKALQVHLAELAVANRRLLRAAMTDELTQLPNRRFAEETLRECWAGASLRDEDISLLMGDVDHFKKINDTYGHLVGDLVLASVARIFREELRTTDTPCRFGGEEFLIICPGTGLMAAQLVAERLRAKIAKAEIVVSDQRIQVTISIGVASRRSGQRPMETVEALLKAADDSAYRSKVGGRNRVTAFGLE